MALQRVSCLSGYRWSFFGPSDAWRFGPDRDDICTALRYYYLHLALGHFPKQQVKAALRRWELVQRQLFSGTTFNPNLFGVR